MDKLTLTNNHISAYCSKLCRDITNSHWRPDYIVGLSRGGLLPAVMISHYFNVPMHSLNVSLRDSDIGPESNCWMAEDAYNGINILVVDDINDSGATFNWIKKDWQASAFPNDAKWNYVWQGNVRFATLIENLSSECNDVTYVAREINKAENNVWVDFPWEDWWAK